MIYLFATKRADSGNFGSLPFTNNPTVSVEAFGEEMTDRAGTHQTLGVTGGTIPSFQGSTVSAVMQDPLTVGPRNVKPVVVTQVLGASEYHFGLVLS